MTDKTLEKRVEELESDNARLTQYTMVTLIWIQDFEQRLLGQQGETVQVGHVLKEIHALHSAIVNKAIDSVMMKPRGDSTGGYAILKALTEDTDE